MLELPPGLLKVSGSLIRADVQTPPKAPNKSGPSCSKHC